MATQEVTLNPGESKVVAFQAVPTEAKVYTVTVNGLTGTFTAFLPAEVSRITFNGIGGLGVSPSRLTKRESYNRGTSSNPIYPDYEMFSFGISFRNSLDYDVWVQPFFAFGKWNSAFVPYSPQEDLINRYLLTDPDRFYNIKNDYIDLSAMEAGATGRNMTNKISDTLYMSRAYLKVPAHGEAETGFDNILIGKNARSIREYDAEWATWAYLGQPCLALLATYRTVVGAITVMGKALPPLDLDIDVKSKVWRYQPPEEYGGVYGNLLDLGLEIWGGLLGAAHITNAWGSWTEVHSGDTYWLEWAWIDQKGNRVAPPDWWTE